MSKTKGLLFTAGIVLATAFTLSCEAKDTQATFTDSRDGKVYKKVKIGEQTWLAENLNFNAEGSVCYENNPDNCAKYGRLYDWNTALKVCPKGWHLPNNDEWQELVDAAGGDEAATTLKAASGWDSDGNGTDKLGFSALPSGRLAAGNFYGIGGKSGFWWSASENYGDGAYSRSMSSYSSRVDDRDYYFKSSLLSVRCVQGAERQASGGKLAEYAGVYDGSYEGYHIVLTEKNGKISGLYYGTSDDFDEAREGYGEGFFVAPMAELEIKGDTIKFVLRVKDGDFMDKPIDLKITSTQGAVKAGYKKWENTIRWSENEYIGRISASVGKGTTFFIEQEVNYYGNRYVNEKTFVKKSQGNGGQK